MGQWLNQQVYLGVLKWAVTGAVAYGVAKGWFDDVVGGQLTGELIGVGTLALTILSGRTKHVAIVAAGGPAAVATAKANGTGL